MADDNFNVNFFKPRTDHAKDNMKVVITMVIVWAVAVFGFQVLLILLNKPTPEPTYATFKKVWPEIEKGEAGKADKQAFARVSLMVLGKNIAIKDDHKKVLKQSLSATVNSLLSGNADTSAAASAIGLGEKGFDPLLSDILKSSLVPVETDQISSEDKKAVPGIMKLYLVHNRSGLTDTRFLGFPFHYWFTGQFLLILFVGLCWLFCKITDKSNTKYNLETE